MFCQKCGKDNPEDAKFCIACGANLDFTSTHSINSVTIQPTMYHDTVSQDSKNIALLLWLGTLCFGFIPGLILYLVKKDDAYVQEQSKEALNWSITTAIGYAVGFVLTFVLIGFLVFAALVVCHLVFCIMGAVSTSNGKNFKVPYTLRLLK